MSWFVSETLDQEGQEVIRMSQWAEMRHMYVVDGVPKKEIARRFGLDVKTVRKAIGREDPPTARRTPRRPRRLDRWREKVVELLRLEPRITAKRIGRLLGDEAGFVETLPELDVSAVFPSCGSPIRRPLPSTGSLREGSPASPVLRGAPTPVRPSVPLHFVAFDRRYH
jgi:hypothetical protein